MSWIRQFFFRLGALFSRNKIETGLADEIKTHLEMAKEANLAAGMSAADAQDAALRQFGGVEQIKERFRDERGFRWLNEIGRDFKYGARQLRRNPGFTALAVLTLALGIGVNSTTISFLDDMILRPALRNRQENLVALHTARTGGDRSFRPFNYAEYVLLGEKGGVFSDVAAMQFDNSAVGMGEDVQRRLLCLVSQNYFSVLGIDPYRGRFFTAEEARPNSAMPVAVASYVFWQHLGGREDFIGSQIRVDGHSCTVVGIAPPGFGGLQWSIGPDAWLPLGMSSGMVGGWGYSAINDLLDPRSYRLDLFGKLRPGLAPGLASSLLSPLNTRLNELAAAGPSESRELSLTAPSKFNLSNTEPQDEGGVVIYALSALGMTVTVLLVACLNVANMVFSRGVSRRREIAIRLCLGASRLRVVRQLLVEGFLLAIAGGAVGLVLSGWASHITLQMAARSGGMFALHLRTKFDWPLLGATFGLCLLATLVFSLMPALRATRLNLVEDLKQQGGDPGSSGRWIRFFALRHCAVMMQISLSLVLLFGAGLFLRAVQSSERDRGFETRDGLVANLDYHLAQTPPKDVPVRQKALLARVARMPGIESLALASAVPFNFERDMRQVYPLGASSGGPSTASHDDSARFGALTVVSHGYFATLGIPLLRGRDFTQGEALGGAGHSVAIIDESLGRALFGDTDPVGRFVVMNKDDADGRKATSGIEVVGVVHSPREDAFQREEDLPRIYRPLGQSGFSNTYLHVRLAQSTATLPEIIALRRELRVLDPSTPLLLCEPLSVLVGSNLNVWSLSFLSDLFFLFGVIAVVLAVVGLYGVKSYAVARRTREIGIRIAVGAHTFDVMALILKQGVLQAVVGIAAGLVLAAFAGQFLAKLLYGVHPVEPMALIGAAVILGLVSVLACLFPALRATRVNPSDALRSE